MSDQKSANTLTANMSMSNSYASSNGTIADDYDRQSTSSSSNVTINDDFVPPSSMTSSISSFSMQQNTTASASGIKSVQEKLVQDYVKLRSKLTILKNAYKDLSEASVQKDQSLRKYEQEIESLNFRNQQLTSRVEVLQRDLEQLSHQTSTNLAAVSNAQYSVKPNGSNGNLLHDSTNSHMKNGLNDLTNASVNHHQPATMNGSHNKKDGKKVNADLQQLDALSSELQHKINENVMLNRRVSEIEVEFSKKLAKVELTLKQVESEKMLIEKKLESNESSSKILIDKLQNDKIRLELHVIQIENQLRAAYQANTVAAEQATTIPAASSETMATISNDKNNNDEKTDLQANNQASSTSHSHSSTNGKKKKENAILDQLGIQVECLTKLYASLNDISSIRSSYTTVVGKDHQRLIQSCDQLLTKSSSGTKKIAKVDFERNLSDFFDANHKLLAAIINDMPTASSKASSLDPINKKLKIYLNRLVTFLFVPSSSSSTCFVINLTKLLVSVRYASSSSQCRALLPLMQKQNLALLVDLLEKILFVLNEKLSVQYDLGDSYPSSLSMNDESLYSQLSQFKQSLYQLNGLLESTHLGDLLDDIVLHLDTHESTETIEASQNSSDNDLKLKQSNNDAETIGMIASLKDEIESLNLKLNDKETELNQIHGKFNEMKEKTIKDSQDKDTLKKNLENLQTQYVELKQENEIIKLELTHMREETIKAEEKAAAEQQQSALQTQEITAEAAERLTIEHYVKRLEEMNARILFLDAKCIFYYEEMNNVLERLKLQLELTHKQETELIETRDQLERTRTGYETQISTMSDHLIEVNEKLTKQTEENEKLKRDLTFTFSTSPSPMASSAASNNAKNSKNKKPN